MIRKSRHNRAGWGGANLNLFDWFLSKPYIVWQSSTNSTISENLIWVALFPSIGFDRKCLNQVLHKAFWQRKPIVFCNIALRWDYLRYDDDDDDDDDDVDGDWFRSPLSGWMPVPIIQSGTAV